MDKIDFPLKNAIGIFDSGIGGLSVFKEIRKKLPSHEIIYFADQAHVPYGPRDLEEVYFLSDRIIKFLFHLGAKIIVIACNTASAAALYPLRDLYLNVPFVGMEPAVKPAVEQTHTGQVGVLATPATFQGKLYNSVVERFAQNVTIYQNTCPGLVQEIEKGFFSSKKIKSILEDALNPMLKKNIDTIVLGCTHYPFVIPTIQKIVGPEVKVIDPSPAIANQTFRKVHEFKIKSPLFVNGKSILITSGPIDKFNKFIDKMNFIPHSYTTFGAEWSEDKNNLYFIQK